MRCMRHQPATILLLATLASTLAACDPPGSKSIGSLDGDTGEDTIGDGGLCGPSSLDLEFHVSPDGQQELALTCAAEVIKTSGGYLVALTDCTDAQGMPATDVTVELDGNWAEPLVHGELQIELHYVNLSVVINEEVLPQRWLSLRNPGAEQELLLVAVDAIYTYPNALGDAFEFDYSPLAIDPVEGDCPLIENVACAPIQPGALAVSIDDGPFTIPQGSEFGIGANGDTYHVIVEQCHSPVDDCSDYPPGVYEFNIVATPS
jgi:hypothetical protein